MQIFRPRSNTVARSLLVCVAALPAVVIASGAVLMRTQYITGVGRTPVQPVPFSHQHHVAETGIDCRYCHTGVETSAVAGIPPTETCMTCHSQLWTDAEMLAPVRESLAAGRRLHWQRVNALADYVYFDHSVHVMNGVACASCHGAVGSMPLIRQTAPLTMEWCLACHRDPGPHLVSPDARFTPFDEPSRNSSSQARALLALYGVTSAGLTDCSVCHR
ncbi:MAG: cytochrome c3 family protein [Burkholderiaceae bacterium]